VIASNDNDNLLAFLMACSRAANSFEPPQTFLRFQNKAYKALTGDTFYERFVFSDNDNRLRCKFLIAILSLLEETKRSKNDDEDEVPIDKICGFFNSMQSSDEASGSSADSLNVRLKCEIMLSCFAAYWQSNDSKIRKIADKSLFLEMAIDIVDGNEEEFKMNFSENLQSLQKIASESIPELLSVLLLISMKFGRMTCIDCINEHKELVRNDLKFTENMQNTQTTVYVAKKLLENGYKPGANKDIDRWITEPIFNDFLDARITRDGDLAKIDYDFLVNQTDDHKVQYEDPSTLIAIIDSVDMNESIVHPVLKTYIELKTQIHKSIHQWNFWTFVLVFMVPFGILLMTQMFPGESQIEFYVQKVAQVVCPLSILFLILRLLLLLQINGSQWIVLLEVSLIASACLSLGWSYFGDKDSDDESSFMRVTSLLTAVLAVSIAIIIYPFSKNPVHWKIMKQIIKENLKYLIFGIMIMAVYYIAVGGMEESQEVDNMVNANTSGIVDQKWIGKKVVVNYYQSNETTSAISEKRDHKNFKAVKLRRHEKDRANCVDQMMKDKQQELKNCTESKKILESQIQNRTDEPEDDGIFSRKKREIDCMGLKCSELNEACIESICNEKYPIPSMSFLKKFVDNMNNVLSYELAMLLFVVLLSYSVLFFFVKDLAEIAMQVEFYPGLKIKAEEFIRANEKCRRICKDSR
jgi:hypothetical protein